MDATKIYNPYFIKKLRKNDGNIADIKPIPNVAPQTGAPTPQACKAASPRATATILIIDPVYVLAMIIFSLTFLTRQVNTNAKKVTKRNERITCNPPTKISFGNKKYPAIKEIKKTILQ